jgi:hypothetical protein
VPGRQLCPQAPQFAESALPSTQAPRHVSIPPWQRQLPLGASQVWFGGHDPHEIEPPHPSEAVPHTRPAGQDVFSVQQVPFMQIDILAHALHA